MTNLARPTPRRAARAAAVHPQQGLDALRSARRGAAALPGLSRVTYARDHVAFESRSDQRSLIAGHLAARLARRSSGPVSLLSVGCGDGSLDARLATTLTDVLPARAVRYVGVDPYGGSATAFAAAMAGLERSSLTTEVHRTTFADATVRGPFDVVTFVHSMYYVPDVAEALLAAHALLRPGGELLVLSAPRGALNKLVDVLAPRVQGHRQWFSEDVVAGLAEAGLRSGRTVTLRARLDLAAASDRVLDFAVQARLTPELRRSVRAYLDAVSVVDPLSGEARVPHPVDVHRVPSAAPRAAPGG